MNDGITQVKSSITVTSHMDELLAVQSVSAVPCEKVTDEMGVTQTSQTAYSDMHSLIDI